MLGRVREPRLVGCCLRGLSERGLSIRTMHVRAESFFASLEGSDVHWILSFTASKCKVMVCQAELHEAMLQYIHGCSQVDSQGQNHNFRCDCLHLSTWCLQCNVAQAFSSANLQVMTHRSRTEPTCAKMNFNALMILQRQLTAKLIHRKQRSCQGTSSS